MVALARSVLRNIALQSSLIQFPVVSRIFQAFFRIFFAHFLSGHVFCGGCCKRIIDRAADAARREEPTCPFCRGQFEPSQVRMIRADLSSSGWDTPRRVSKGESTDRIAQETARILSTTSNLSPGSQSEVQRFEAKVSQAALKKCSVEEVSALCQRLEDWLLAQGRGENAVRSWLM